MKILHLTGNLFNLFQFWNWVQLFRNKSSTILDGIEYFCTNDWLFRNEFLESLTYQDSFSMCSGIFLQTGIPVKSCPVKLINQRKIYLPKNNSVKKSYVKQRVKSEYKIICRGRWLNVGVEKKISINYY
jgi:hypothetical protein